MSDALAEAEVDLMPKAIIREIPEQLLDSVGWHVWAIINQLTWTSGQRIGVRVTVSSPSVPTVMLGSTTPHRHQDQPPLHSRGSRCVVDTANLERPQQKTETFHRQVLDVLHDL